eukprot:scaffold182076_cov39-Prasinocladus_malaysianus.AAC.1
MVAWVVGMTQVFGRAGLQNSVSAIEALPSRPLKYLSSAAILPVTRPARPASHDTYMYFSLAGNR